MEIIYTIFKILEIIIFAYLGFAAIYIFIYAFAGLFGHREKKATNNTTRKFAVLIPGYKEDNVIIDVALKAIEQSYPSDLFEVIIIADSFKKETLENLSKINVTVVEVSFEKSTKSKALNKAMQTIGDNYDIALILDADNIMDYHFIDKINNAFNNGYIAVQGHRVAKNINTSFALLDAISEEVNNHIFRKGHRVLGLSSALIGSGMAFEYKFFKNIMANVNAIGGFDKELELKLLKDKQKIEYVHEALVYDEKVQKTEVFANQRKRWLSAQFVYFGRYFFPGLFHLFAKGNIDFFDKVYQMVSPPRVILLGLVSIITMSTVAMFYFWNNMLNNITFFGMQYWLIVFGITFLAFTFSIPKEFYNKKTLVAILTLPKAFFVMFLSLFKLGGANKKFIHTAHGTENNN